MRKQGRFIFFIVFLALFLSGCLGSIWTGASAVYDRHSIYKKLNDYELFAKVNEALAVNRTFNNPTCVIDINVFNGDILLSGHLPSLEMMDELKRRLNTVKGYRRLFNEMKIQQVGSNTVQDSWITTKIRSQIFADSSIDPNAFKIVTSDRIVYLMGDVKPDEGKKVINIARNTNGVVQVVKILRYFMYQTQKNMA
jgi:osmotically-inducible protein OsmY